jgi:MFS family permease
MAMMRLRPVWTTNFVALLIGFAMYSAFGFVPQFSQTPPSAGYGFGASVTESGLLLLPQAIASFVVGLFCARLARVIGAKAVTIIGCLIASGGMAMVAFAHAEKWQISVGNAIGGVGMGLVFACLSNLIVAAVPPEQTGVASGMNANIRTIGGSIGAAIMASVVTAKLLPSGLPAESGYTHGFILLSASLLVAAAVAVAIPNVTRETIEEHLVGEPVHAELGLVAGGTLVGDKSE